MVVGSSARRTWPALLTALVGVLVLAGAVAVGLWPVTITGGSGAVACGSAWLPDDTAAYRADESSVIAVDGRGGHVVACVEQLTTPLVISVVTAVVGLVVLVGAVRTLRSPSRDPA